MSITKTKLKISVYVPTKDECSTVYPYSEKFNSILLSSLVMTPLINKPNLSYFLIKENTLSENCD